jgi:hypothetical protein
LEPGDVATPIVKSHHDSADDGETLPPMPVIDPSELIGCTFLMDKEDGQRYHAQILNVINEEEICKHIGEHERELLWRPRHIQFVCSVNDDDYKEILSYNELMDYIEKDKQQMSTRVLDTMFLLSGRMGRSRLNLSISLARMIQ